MLQPCQGHQAGCPRHRTSLSRSHTPMWEDSLIALDPSTKYLEKQTNCSWVQVIRLPLRRQPHLVLEFNLWPSGPESGFHCSFSSLLFLPASIPPFFLQLQEASSFRNRVNIPSEVKVIGPLLYLVRDPAKGQNQYHKSQPNDNKEAVVQFFPF